MSKDEEAVALLERMMKGWSEQLEKNKATPYKQAGPSSAAVRLMEKADRDPSRWPTLIRQATAKELDRDAICVVCCEAWTLIKRGRPLPEPLAGYVANILEEKINHANRVQGKSGRNVVRNAFIVQAILQLNRELRLTPAQSFPLIARVLQKSGYAIKARGVGDVWEKIAPHDHEFRNGYFKKIKAPS